MDTPYDDVIAAVRAGLARSPRRLFRDLALALDPDQTGEAERVVAQTIVAELDAARYAIRPLPPPADHGPTRPTRHCARCDFAMRQRELLALGYARVD